MNVPLRSVSSEPLTPIADRSAAWATQSFGQPSWTPALRAGWLALVLFALALHVLGAAPRVEQVADSCGPGEVCPTLFTETDRAVLEEAGVRPRSVVWYLEGVASLMVLLCTVAAWMIFWRQPRNLTALVASLFLVFVAVAAAQNTQALTDGYPGLAWAVAVFSMSTGVLTSALFLIFPDGRFVPSWSRWIFVVWAGSSAVLAFGPLLGAERLALEVQQRNSITLPFLLVAVACQVYRYRFVSDSIDRQRVKWALLAFGVQVAVFAGNIVAPSMAAGSDSQIVPLLTKLVSFHVYVVTFLAIPVAIGFSILRYRLWDVDLILHRSLTYGSLTGLLVLLFAGFVVSLQTLVRLLTGGQNQTLVLGASMLLVGALFQPARAKLRRVIDRSVFGIGLDYRATMQLPPGASLAARLADTRVLDGFADWTLIGRGGMAEVYRAHDAGRDRPVAVKVLHADVDSEEGIRRFEREAEIVAALDHPNIVKLLGYRQTDSGLRVMVMDYVSDLDLSKHLPDDGMPLDHALDLLGDLADALDYAHSRGVVHRDVKPSNVLLERVAGVTPTLRAVLTDFGIAKSLGGTQLTRSNLIGTVTHMSPEQIRDPARVDARSDIYSLGVLAFQLLTGKVPFDGRSPTSVLLAHLQHPPPDPRKLRPDLPRAAARAIVRALAKNPADRPATARELVEEMAAGRSEMAVTLTS
ncbi:MAG TPA: serine/threonine-protein kinase [Thermoanaerobaculia bacterium]|nr:serine/threonine-protein kinase [Thermoanaerobaculia bacterium]